MTDAEDRLWVRLWQELDTIKHQQDNKVDQRAFGEFKADVVLQFKELQDDVSELKSAAITPDQVTNLIGSKLQESQARGVTSRERLVRYAVALVVFLTFILQVYRGI